MSSGGDVGKNQKSLRNAQESQVLAGGSGALSQGWFNEGALTGLGGNEACEVPWNCPQSGTLATGS